MTFGDERFEVWLNDENLKPNWVEHPAEFSEFHVRRHKKKELVIVIGESWTYGETLPHIATGLRKYDLESQLTSCFGPKLALQHNADYYQYAVPGNCNAYMFLELDRILDYVNTNFKYKKIHVYVQLTEPGREMPITKELAGTAFHGIYKTAGMTFEQWLINYDNLFLDYLSETVNKHSNVSAIVWKNFCCFQNTNEYTNFKIVKESWIKLTSSMLGVQLEMQKFQSIGWYAEFEELFRNRITFERDFSKVEIDKIEKSNEFIKGNFLHNNHPNAIAHTLWAYKLFKEMTND